ncbi:MAG TPA: HlyD family secretion protein [Pseudoduganella sp.]
MSNSPAQDAAWQPPVRRPALTFAIGAGTALAALSVLWGWRLPPFDGAMEETANAYVRGRVTVIAPQVSGYIASVPVHDYETVQAGQVLATIDEPIYRARLEQAQANLAAHAASLGNQTQALASRKAGLQSQAAVEANARAQLARARADMARADELAGDGAISARERDQTVAALRQAEAALGQARAAGEIARQELRTVEVGRGTLAAQVDAARAQLHLAEIDLQHTAVRAPSAGRLGEVGARPGQYVTAGSQLMALVPAERWVIAHFKEAQTRCIAPGQPASVQVDALGGAPLRGRVQRIAPAAASEFSLVKTDNGVGNFIKIPQRVGVRIELDGPDPRVAQLRPGLSVEAQVQACAR